MKMEQMMDGGGFGFGGDGGTNFFLGKFESTTNTITCNDIATERPSTQSSRISMINCFDDYRLLQDNLFSPWQKNPNYQIINNDDNHGGEGDFEVAVVVDSLPSRSQINHQDAELNDFWTKFTLAAGTVQEQEQDDDNDFDYENILRDETIPIPHQQQQQHQIYQQQQQNNDHNFNYQPPVAQQQQQQQQQAYHENSFLSRSCPPPDTLTWSSSSSWSSSVQQPFESRPLINVDVDVDSVVGPRPTTTTTTTSTFEHQDHHLSSSSSSSSSSPTSSQQFHQCQWLECNGMFATIMELVEHVESGHIEHQRRLQQTTMQILNHYVCQWKDCQRSMKPFDQRYKLRNHLRQHTKEKPKKCEFEGCNRSFSRQENLRIHMRSHTNERPYLCPFCPKAFRNSSDKAKHRRTHDNPRPCVCNYLNCNKRYTDPSSLRKHKKNHHPEELCKLSSIHSLDYNGLSRSWSAEPTTVTGTNTANHHADHHGTSLNQNLGHTWSNYVFNQFNSSNNNQLPEDNFWDTNQNAISHNNNNNQNNNNNDNQWIMDNGFIMAEQSTTTMMMNKSATTTTICDHGFGGHHQYQYPDPESAQAFNMDYSNNSSLSAANGLNGASDDDDDDDDFLNLADFLSDQIGNNLRVGP